MLYRSARTVPGTNAACGPLLGVNFESVMVGASSGVESLDIESQPEGLLDMAAFWQWEC